MRRRQHWQRNWVTRLKPSRTAHCQRRRRLYRCRSDWMERAMEDLALCPTTCSLSRQRHWSRNGRQRRRRRPSTYNRRSNCLPPSSALDRRVSGDHSTPEQDGPEKEKWKSIYCINNRTKLGFHHLFYQFRSFKHISWWRHMLRHIIFNTNLNIQYVLKTREKEEKQARGDHHTLAR